MAALLLTTSGAHLAQAVEEPASVGQDTVELVRLNSDGSWVPVEAPKPLKLEKPQNSLSTSSSGGAVTPNLIGFGQWYSCWVLGNSSEVFAIYYWIQGSRNVTLQCGDSNYGYKHIVGQGHDTDWDNIYNIALSNGWSASAYGANSWDDLMNIVLANQLGVGGSYYYENYSTNKACTWSTYGLYNTSTGTIVYSFGARAVWSMNQNRIITSFPDSSGYCNA